MHYIITYTLRNDKHLLDKEHTRFTENINNSYTLLQTVWPPNSADADNHTDLDNGVALWDLRALQIAQINAAACKQVC